MKYKAKFSAEQCGVTQTVIKGDTYESESFFNGVIVFIPFNDTCFFEPVKTRKFEIEVSEEHVDSFSYMNRNQSWTVTEITEPSWIDNYRKSGSYNTEVFSNDELYTIDIRDFKFDYQFNKVQGVKWLKDRFDKGLRESKDLADFIFAMSC